MKKKILFRADGNQTMGLGHLYRLFAVIEMLKNDYDFKLVVKSSSTIAVIPDECEVVLMPDEIDIFSEPDWLTRNFKPESHIVIADGYQFDYKYQEQLKNNKYQLVYIDDLVQSSVVADVVINHAPSLTNDDYGEAAYTRYGLGPKYALLRPAFLECAAVQRPLTKTDTAFVCFGGADMLNLSLKATEALLQTTFVKTIHLVLGQAYDDREIRSLQNNSTKKLHIHRNLSASELVAVMSSCNFAIVPTSTILYELCCVKMPILGGYFVDNQRRIYTAMVKEKAILDGGDFSKYEVADFIKAIDDKFSDLDAEAYVQTQGAIFDGKSGKRILGLVNALNITFRPANASDLQPTFEWSNDEVVRKNSYQSEPITIKGHTKWFLDKIKSSDTLFLIILVNGRPAGVVRYENGTTSAVVGILISEAYRGQNLAPQILRKSAKIFTEKFSAPIIAYIKKDNMASTRSFKKAGYTFLEEKEVQGHKSYVYKLEQKK